MRALIRCQATNLSTGMSGFVQLLLHSRIISLDFDPFFALCSLGASGPWSRPPRAVLCRPRGRRPVPLAGDHHGPTRVAVPGRSLLPHHPLPHRLPVQAAQGGIHHSHLPPKHQLQRVHLLRHPQESVVARAHHLKGTYVHLLCSHHHEFVNRRPQNSFTNYVETFSNKSGLSVKTTYTSGSNTLLCCAEQSSRNFLLVWPAYTILLCKVYYLQWQPLLHINVSCLYCTLCTENLCHCVLS